jgi:aryl-alcohol dehydrogenase-like predicted oxidoreductase
LRALYQLVAECGLSLPELALRWVISNPAIHTVLMGARSAAEVEGNVAAVERGPLPSDLMAKLAVIGDMLPYRPFGEPFGIGWRMGNPHSYRGPGVA